MQVYSDPVVRHWGCSSVVEHSLTNQYTLGLVSKLRQRDTLEGKGGREGQREEGREDAKEKEKENWARVCLLYIIYFNPTKYSTLKIIDLQ